MMREAVHLVRTVHRTETIAAVVQSAVDLTAQLNRADLWLTLLDQGVAPECDEEVDQGVGVYTSAYRPELHASLPVVRLIAGFWVASSPARSAQLSRAPDRQSIAAGVGTRGVVRLMADTEQYEVKRFTIEVPDGTEIDRLSGDDLWWDLPTIEAEVDERNVDFGSLELEVSPSRATLSRKGEGSSSMDGWSRTR